MDARIAPRRIIVHYLISLALLASACAPGVAASGERQDRAFAREASQAELANVRLAALALERTSRPAVVSFATRVRDVDSNLAAQLGSIARVDGFPVADTINSNDERRLARLRHVRAGRFDHDYLALELKAEREALTDFDRERVHGKNGLLVAFAKRSIPLIEQHIWIDRQAAVVSK